MQARLVEAGRRLSQSVDALTSDIVGVDSDRHRCQDLAGRYDDFATRMTDEYPSLAGPGRELAGLFRQLDALLGRASSAAESAVSRGGVLADQILRRGTASDAC